MANSFHHSPVSDRLAIRFTHHNRRRVLRYERYRRIGATMLKMQKTFTQSTQAIDHIIAFTFATGFMTSAVELTAAICFWTHPGNYIWVPLLIAVSGLYTASFLAMLNQRRHFRHMLPDHDFRALAELKAMPRFVSVCRGRATTFS
ncbi:hypothetical protein EDC04DRAFT_225799 [Pisolithus marmoratus]|nr:hypothetical protein EDC04DRAFT_225799 [Pisolithus marmoratus]